MEDRVEGMVDTGVEGMVDAGVGVIEDDDGLEGDVGCDSRNCSIISEETMASST